MIKVTTWNAEWLELHWGVVSGKYAPGQSVPGTRKKAPDLDDATLRIKSTEALLHKLDADIIFLCEAPIGNSHTQEFVSKYLPNYDLIKHENDDDYHVKGAQGLWFVVKKNLSDQVNPRLLNIDVWKSFAADGSSSIKPSGRWSVSIPRLKDFGTIKDVPVSTRATHGYHRHPQTLVFELGGSRHEIIGAHLKSKFTGSSPRKRREDENFEEYAKDKKVRKYLSQSHSARVKLSSEATNIRAYIDQRFKQESDPSIVVLGDLNDGPGKELLEREYLLHDLISNLQGEVFFARRFLNHALFDYPQNLRWTSYFKDKLMPERNPHILLDHILFTQALTRSGTSPLWADANAGKVEHLVFEEVESQFGKGNVSDHRPVSLQLSVRDNFAGM